MAYSRVEVAHSRVEDAISYLDECRHREIPKGDLELIERQYQLLTDALESDPKMAQKLAEMFGLLDVVETSPQKRHKLVARYI